MPFIFVTMFLSLLFVFWFCGSTSFHFWEASLSVVSVFGITLKNIFPNQDYRNTWFLCFLLVILWFRMSHRLICSSGIRWCVFSVLAWPSITPNKSHSIYYPTLPHYLMHLFLVLTSALGFVTDTIESLEKTLGKNFTSRYKNFPNKWHLRYKIIRAHPCSPEAPCCTAVTAAEWPSAGLCRPCGTTRTPASGAELPLLSSLLAPQGCAPAPPSCHTAVVFL